jgi:hypothetical protein
MIRKIDDLNFEREYASHGGRNDIQDIEFNADGIEIDHDAISWADIKTAYEKIFCKQIQERIAELEKELFKAYYNEACRHGAEHEKASQYATDRLKGIGE